MVCLAVGAAKGLSSVSKQQGTIEGETYSLVVVVEIYSLMESLLIDHALVPQQLVGAKAIQVSFQ